MIDPYKNVRVGVLSPRQRGMGFTCRGDSRIDRLKNAKKDL